MPRLFRVVYEEIGEITDEQLRQLAGALEEEDSEEQDYFINADTLAYLADVGVDPTVLDLLSTSVGDEGSEIYWESDESAEDAG